MQSFSHLPSPPTSSQGSPSHLELTPCPRNTTLHTVTQLSPSVHQTPVDPSIPKWEMLQFSELASVLGIRS